MENQIKLSFNGQAVEKDDVDQLGESGGLADDRVFAEFLRMTPYDGATVTKGIFPFGHETSAQTSLVVTNGAAGSVKVNPFRALVGPRTAVATDAKKNWRDIRSAICIGTTTLHQVVNHAANASGNPRWDLIQAAVTVDTGTASVLRKVKDTGTGNVTDQSVAASLTSTVVLSVVAGTPNASPQWPSATADAAGVYYVPIAYVRIPNGFNGTSTVTDSDIAVVAPTVRPANTTGSGLQAANAHYTSGSSCLTSGVIGTWGSTGTKPGIFLPAVMKGGTSLLIAMDLTTGSLSHASGAILDTRDWRGRLCKWAASVTPASNKFTWVGNGASDIAPNGIENFTTANQTGTNGISSTCNTNLTAAGFIQLVPSTNIGSTQLGQQLNFKLNGSGQITCTWTGNPNCLVVLWIDFSGPIDNEIG